MGNNPRHQQRHFVLFLIFKIKVYYLFYCKYPLLSPIRFFSQFIFFNSLFFNSKQQIKVQQQETSSYIFKSTTVTSLLTLGWKRPSWTPRTARNTGKSWPSRTTGGQRSCWRAWWEGSERSQRIHRAPRPARNRSKKDVWALRLHHGNTKLEV